jgi:hypothetical protein
MNKEQFENHLLEVIRLDNPDGTIGPNHIPPPYDIWGRPYTRETFLRHRALMDNNRAELLDELHQIQCREKEILAKLKFFPEEEP